MSGQIKIERFIYLKDDFENLPELYLQIGDDDGHQTFRNKIQAGKHHGKYVDIRAALGLAMEQMGQLLQKYDGLPLDYDPDILWEQGVANERDRWITSIEEAEK